jgi:uncharacterized membrane protein YedE/YeeE
MSVSSDKGHYWHPYLGGVLLGLVLFLSFFVTSHGLGASGGVNRVAVAVEDLIVPEHVDKTPYLAALAGGDRDPLSHWIVWEVAGVLLGGFVSGLLRGRVRVQTYRGPQISRTTRWAFAFLGGMLMGYGARLARGCTSGQALSGGAVLSVGSWAFMLAVFAGGYGLAWFVKRLWQPEG